jgi:outer membrane protein assembly factor BamA
MLAVDRGESMKLIGLGVAMAICCGAVLVAQTAVQQAEERPPMVRSIKFEKMGPLRVREILRTFEEKDVKLKVETPFDQREVDHAKAVLTALLAERGQPDARVNVEVAPIPPRSVEVKFTVADR